MPTTKKAPFRGYVLAEALGVEVGADPKWNKLFPVGVTKYRDDFGRDGKIDFSREYLSTMERNFKALFEKTGHELQVNYHHLGGVTLDASAPLESTVASGWIRDVQLRADGLYGLIEWTERARGFIGAKELRCISPEFHPDYTNRDTGKRQGPTLLGAALTNTPFLKELPAVAAADNQALPAEGAPQMDKKLLCKILKLSDNATDAEIEAKLNALATSEEKLTLSDGQGARALADVHAKVTKLEDSNKALAESNKQLGDKLSKLEGEKKAGEAKAFVDGLVKERKIQPVQTEAVTKLALSDLETAKAVYKDAKSFADTTEVGITGPAGDEPTGAQTLSLLDTEAAKLAKEHGLSLVDAKIRAMELNPKLAKAAASATR